MLTFVLFVTAMFLGSPPVDSEQGRGLAEARALLERSEHRAAIEQLEELLERSPQNARTADVWHLLASAYEARTREVSLFRKLRTSRRQREALERALEIAPEHVEARKDLADFFYYAPKIAGGSKAKAATHERRLLAVDAGEGHALIARHALDSERYDRAIEQFRSAVASETGASSATRASWWYWLGVAYRLAERAEEAFDPLERSLELDPGLLEACYQIGRAAEITGLRVSRGIECLKAFLERYPATSRRLPRHRAHLVLAKLYLSRDERAAARRHLSESLELQPDNAEAQRLLATLP